MASEKRPFEDDGRTIADMSGVSRPSLFSFRPREEGEAQRPAEPRREARPWENSSLSPGERRAAIGGALRAAVLIAGAYIVVFGAVIWLLLTLWR